jgi:hypothetical protein
MIRRVSLLEREVAIVERAPDDHGGDAGGGERAQIVEPRDAARGDHVDRDGARELGGRLRRGAGVHAVAAHVGVEHRGRAPALGALRERDRSDAAALHPALHRDHAVARVDGDDDPPRMRAAHLPHHLRMLDRRRPDDDAVRAGRDRRLDVGVGADAAADLHRHRRRADEAGDQIVLVACARERAVEIDDVDALGARGGHLAHELPRRLVIDGRRVAAALLQSHRLAAHQIDRRDDLHAFTKFSRRRSPMAWLFSGWN